MSAPLPAQTTRLILRAFEEKDAEAFSAYRSDPQVALYQGWQAPFTLEQARQFIAEMRVRNAGQPDQWYQIALELKDNGNLIGDCAFHLSVDSRQAEIGMTLANSFQNRGYAAEAVKWLLGYLFGQLKVHRVFANIDPRNQAAIHSVEKLGLHHEGLFIQSLWLKGEWVDEDWYALLREEWVEKHQSS
jgi:RimJ/RimL family protein N-acetyltransferase